jgi:hypothetical protein
MNNVKDQLARLLAQEDLIVEHRQVETAQFNVETRVLTLPMWKKASNDVLDLLIAHEVGHALYTPNDWSFENEVPVQFVNVTEDIRIEKMMKRRYPGLAKTFFRGYKDLSDQDFFALGDSDLTTYNIADRLNIHFKIGNFITVPFTQEEEEFISIANSLETFADAVEFAKVLFKYCKDAVKQKEPDLDIDLPQSPQSGSSQNPSQDFGNEGDSDSEDEQENQGVSPDLSGSRSPESKDSEDQMDDLGAGRHDTDVKTDANFNDFVKDLIDENQSEYDYIEMPNFDWDQVIVPNNRVHEHIESSWIANGFDDNHTEFYRVDSEYRQFKKSCLQEVNYLVKEFECKKSAASYARSSTSRTGVLDCTKLHTYKYNEDLFKKVTNLHQGKNHGLIFNLDWSGSMQETIFSTFKQLISLVTFCRKVGIAYTVYAFSDGWIPETARDYSHNEANKLWIHPDFSMLTLLSSKSNNSQHERQCRSLFRIAASHGRVNFPTYYPIARKMHLSGTPLNEAVLSMFHVVPKFKQENKCEKVHIINLTDGEGHPICRSKMVRSYRDESDVIIRNHIHPNCLLRDRKTGKTYKFGYNQWAQTGTFVENFRDRFPECEIISIRLLASREWNRYKTCDVPFKHDIVVKADEEWKKTRSYINPHTAYTLSYVLRSESLDNDVEFEVSEDASKAQIKNAFKKSLTGKKANKKILSSFIEQIA